MQMLNSEDKESKEKGRLRETPERLMLTMEWPDNCKLNCAGIRRLG